MALFNSLLIVLIVQLLSDVSCGHPKPELFRKDYTFLEKSQAFYKVHTTRRAWKDAKKQCQLEGASMFYPEDYIEADAVMELWKKSEPYGWIYLGVSDLLAKGVWETVDGRPLLDVYSNWGAGQPDDTGGVEDCVLWRRDKTLNDYSCHEAYPFICKKSLLSLGLDAISEAKPIKKPKPCFDRKDYTFIEESQAFYKVHTTRKAFHDARKQCRKEGTILFYPEDDVEAEAVMGLWNRTEPYGWIYLGITDLLEKGTFKTVDGRRLLDVYSNWGAGQPDDTGGVEDCVLWRRDKTLNDYSCHEAYPFICKKSLLSLGLDAISEAKPIKKPKPCFDRKDYTFIEESQAFYKVHTTRKAFHDARKQCRKEGTILFYPEDDVEAEAVMGLWNRTERYGWIYLGITDLLEKGTFKTVDGRRLLDVYSNWGAGQPDDTGGVEDCVLWRRDKTLNDYSCHEAYPFICKKSLLSLDLDATSEAKPIKKPKPCFDRKDYTFIEESQAFYKVHTTRMAFHDARMQCQKEGTILFYPEDDVEAEAVMGLWNRTEPYGWIYLGITDLLVNGTFETVDGRPLLDVYSNWGAGQPDDTGGVEDCVLWRRDKTLNDYSCHEAYPFICKKSLLSLGLDAISEAKPIKKPKPCFDRKDYTFIEESQAFYKVHTTRKAFHDARMQCQKEGTILFYPEDDVEAEAVMGLWNRTEPYGWIYLGITDLLVKGNFETVDGRRLLDVYSNWGAGQPDGTGGIEDCVLWRRDKTLNDYSCHEAYPFICKKSLLSLGLDATSEAKPIKKQKPCFDRNDYTFIEESQAFYKVHTTRMAFHDARMQCQKEGTILFYPEDDVEAEAVMGLWNRTEPYGWIYLGITDLLVKGNFETVDGRRLLDVYSNWGAGQPDDTGGVEDCVLWRHDKTLNDYSCHEAYPFICKKSLLSLGLDATSEAKPIKKPKPCFDRKDYTFIEESQAFYKVHTTRMAFHDARMQCQKEGTILFYPEDDVEAEAVMGLWNRTEPYGWIYLGITDLLVNGTFETVDGRPLLDVYSNWGASQPDDTGGVEDCVLWRRDKTLNDYSCHEAYPFICKKSLLSLGLDATSEAKPIKKPKPCFDRKGYTFIEESQAFYKVHTTRMAFHDARMQCQKEGTILFYPEDDVEAEAVMGLWNRTEPYGWIYLGITDLLVNGTFETVDGRPLLDVYSNWGASQPDDTGGVEDCVLWGRDKTLNDYSCHEAYPFICKKSLLSLGLDAISEAKPIKKPKPCFDRKDYNFIEESQAFYKVHTTRKAFHDARMQCQKEGTVLFYPEDDVEAEAVMGLWNRTEPYGWIYLGITDLLVKGTFETVDGRRLLDVYSNWGAGQPDDTGGVEDCVLWRRDKTLNDYTCHESYPFICKKSLLSLGLDATSEAKPIKKPKPCFDRKDYNFIEESQAFYKVHTTRMAFHDARMQCQKEGTILFYPEDDVEAEAVMGLWNRTEPYGWIYLGITDLLVNGTFETVDGRPLLDVYSNWGAGQPDDTGGVEDCVLWRRDKTLNDYSCYEAYPFICKKSLLSLGLDAISEAKPIKKPKPCFDRKDYTFIEESQAFYKVHTTRKAFHDARMQCQKEGTILFYPEDDVEAEAVMGLWNRTEPYGWIYLGITDLLVNGTFETVDGRPLLDVYSNWGAGQPDDTGGVEDCVLWRRDKTLNDYSCHEAYPFICKKSLLSLGLDAISEAKPIKKPKPCFDRKDYTFIEESQAFYKVHTTRMAFHDARMQCQKEGTILFYPEDDVEAEAVMGLWNRTEPYGWIYLGITDLLVNGTFETVDGRPLIDVYSNWGAGQPDDTGGVEDCVLWRRDKTLNDYSCHEAYPFICKRSLLSLGLDATSEAKPIKKQKPCFDRNDYTFIEESQAFYKVHTTRMAFHDARMQCQKEGTILFYPEDDVEAEAVMGLWNRTEPYGWIYLGITDLLVKGTFETVDGRRLLDVYSNWGAGQPDGTGGIEDCVLWRRDKTLNDYSCHEEYPFICKKSLLSLGSNPVTETKPNKQPKPSFDRKDYTFIQKTQTFYKVHTKCKAFHDARIECQKEDAILFYPEDDVEAEAVMGLWNRTEPYGLIYLGITDLLVKGTFETVDGRPLLDVYSNWGAGQPDDTGGVEDCVLWRRDKTLNDYTCHESYPFICKKSLLSLGSASNTVSQTKPSKKPEPSFDQKNYTFIEESQSFYKVHTIRKAFHDARMQCQKEGAILFYPEDNVEAEAVMGLWNRTESYGWIYLGITDLLVQGTFETVDGRPLLDVYNNWGAGQPDNTAGIEDCVLWRRDKTLNDYSCHEEYPFICKKSRQSLDLNMIDDTPNPSLNSITPSISTFFRKDYTFVEESQAFYKIHTIHRTWQDARKRCQVEGASLFYPEDDVEAAAVIGFWERTQPFKWVYVGISDLLTRGKWETIDGRPLSDVYNNWGTGQPDNVDDIEDCVLWRRDKTLNDYSCHEKNPFICKKSLRDLNWNTLCDIPDPSYHYNKDFGKCYKFHLTPKNWTDAHAACSAEQSYLAIINSQSEAEYLAKITEVASKNKIRGNFLSGAVYLGFHNKDNDGWKTIKGASLEDSGYTGWGNQQPDGGDKENCGSMFYNGRLNDLSCSQRCFYICEHDIGLLSNAVDERFGNW